MKFYAQSLGVRSNSVVLARYGAKEKPKLWESETEEIRILKALLARFDGIEKDLQREKNRQEKAENSLASKEVVSLLTFTGNRTTAAKQTD